MQIFLCSDLHLNHNKSFLYEPRGFTSIEEHDKKIIENWNSVISNDDIVYNLGDECMGDVTLSIDKLNALRGHMKLIRGNHTTDNKIEIYKKYTDIEIIGWADILIDKKWRFYLSHYPTCIGDYRGCRQSRHFSIAGHSHTKNKWQNINTCCYHVELDCHNNTPVLIDEIMADLNWFKSLSPEKQEEIINGNI